MKAITGGLPESLAPDWQSLQALLDTYSFNDIPCRVSAFPEMWTGDDPELQQAAAAACAPCPGLDQCRAYGLRHSKEAGVYGGLTEQQRKDSQ